MRQRLISDSRAVAGERTVGSHRQRHFRRQAAAFQPDGEEARITRRAVAGRRKQHLLAVRRPADSAVGSGMISQTPGHAARRRHGIDIYVAVVFACESDHRTIRRKDRIGFDADACGQAFGIAAFAWHDPQVARINEDDVRAIHRRLLK